jgi:hypothetical protein
VIAFSKFVELHEEMSSCLSEIEQHINTVLEYDLEKTAGAIVSYGVDGREELTIYYLGNDSNLESTVDKYGYVSMMQITSKEELFNFLDSRQV